MSRERIKNIVVTIIFLAIFFSIESVIATPVFAQSGCCQISELGCVDRQEKGDCQDFFPGQNCVEGNKCNVVIQSPFPGSDEVARQSTEQILPVYIRAIFRFGIWLAVAFSVIMIMVAGFIWTTAGGSPERVSNAKSYITSALTGLIIALLSFAILQSINPQLVNLQFPELEKTTTVQFREGQKCCFNSLENRTEYVVPRTETRDYLGFSGKIKFATTARGAAPGFSY